VDENQLISPINQTPEAVPPAPAAPDKKPFYKQTWFFIVGAVVLVSLIGPIISLISDKMTKKSPAEKQFLTMMETAAQKTQVRYNYLLTRPKASDFPAVYAHSLAEYDSVNKKYSLAFVSDGISPRAERCVNGKEYEPEEDPDTLEQAKAAMQTEMKERNPRFLMKSCEYKTPRFQGSFTDGILPVGLTAEQAKNMITGLKGRGGVIYTDEGQSTYKGKKGRKIAFEISEAKTGTKHRANIFFYAFRDGASNKVGNNVKNLDDLRENFETRLQSTTPHPELKGFYIIDEKTNLPIYSEIVTVAGGITDFTPTTLISAYEFPDQLTMNEKTPLTEVGKPE
jgi:hypothetical protein